MTARGRLPALIALALLIAGWEALARATTDSFLIAGPGEIVRWIWSNAGLLGRALAVTLGNAGLGFVLGNLAAVALAAAASVRPRAEPVVSGLALIVFCLPLVATGPILRVLWGPGNGPQVTLAALAVYYTTYLPLVVGLRAAPSTWFDLVRSYGRGRWAELVHVRARAALPYLFAGLQIAAPAAVLGAMVGEFTGAERGLGVLTIRALRALDLPATWALATVAAGAAILAYAGIGALARWALSEAPPMILSPPRATGRGDGTLARLGRGAAVAALAVAAWWAAMEAAGLNRFFAKRPDDLWAAYVSSPGAEALRGTLGAALAETLAAVGPGYAAGLAAGAALAVLLHLIPAAGAVAMPLAVALRSVPIVVTAPLIVLALGREATGTVTLVAVMVFFPTFVACLHGLRQAPGQALDVLRTYAAGPVARLVHVALPAMLPAFFAAARMAVPASILAVTVVEWLATGRGVGALMALSASLSDYATLWGSVVAVAAVSALGYAAVAAVERRVLSVYAAEQAAA